MKFYVKQNSDNRHQESDVRYQRSDIRKIRNLYHGTMSLEVILVKIEV